MKTWTRGQQAELATAAQISNGFLCDVLHRRKTPTIDVARRLTKACGELNIPLKLLDWIDPKSSTSPLFKN